MRDFLYVATKGRKRRYPNAAAKQKAYRERKAGDKPTRFRGIGREFKLWLTYYSKQGFNSKPGTSYNYGIGKPHYPVPSTLGQVVPSMAWDGCICIHPADPYDDLVIYG